MDNIRLVIQGGFCVTQNTMIENIRESLILKKSDLLNKSSDFLAQTGTEMNMADEAEAAALDVSKNVSIHLHERDRQSLLMIERALGKIDAGTYGKCELCGEDIDVKRLAARPFASLCISCMEDAEDPRLRS